MESTVIEICKLAGPLGILVLAVGNALSLGIKSYTRIQLAKIVAAAGSGSLTDSRLGGLVMRIGEAAENSNVQPSLPALTPEEE